MQGKNKDANSKPKKKVKAFLLILLALIAVGGGACYYFFGNTSQNLMSKLDETVALIQECDAIVVEIDRAIDEEVSEDRLQFLQGLIDGIPATKEKLTRAYDDATYVVERLHDEDHMEVAEAAQEAADARNEMLNYGKSLIQNDIDAFNAATSINSAYSLILEADELMRESTSNALTGAISDSIEYDKQAKEKLASAQDSLDNAKDSYASADFSAVENYLAHKIKAADSAYAMDEAILNGDIETAKSQNDTFESEEDAAAKCASALPSNPLTPILEAFETNTLRLRSMYNESRQRATNADSILRQYLGISDMDEDQESENESSTEDGDQESKEKTS